MDTFSKEFVVAVFTGSFWLVTAITVLWWVGISFLLVFFIHRIVEKFLHSFSRENGLRFAFLIVPFVLITTLLAVNRPVFPLATYSIVLGAFLGALWETQRAVGLIELNSLPSASDVKFVQSFHQRLTCKSFSFAKTLIDVVLSILLMIILSPLFLLCGIAVWVNDPGPILIAKFAVGRLGVPFREYKLRSMIKHAEQHTGAVQATHRDPRIIWIGHFLRASHFDEIPQLWNVIRREMSLVGPRPEKVVRVKRFLEQVPNYAARHVILPGITGWAQIHQTYYTPAPEKLVFDLHYIEHQSVRWDLQILWNTLPSTTKAFSSPESER